ncbi:hypothetical protein CRM22_009700 [Opisthorchis felineus]|uniref:C2 domain-containing protein n=1 Tax=Opisthorchis felineus TaxID=147828 RepID=A0A4V3SCU7_OPIFE|nr:hypothetical protein CRM22_009700 [Opisthorchis felineus]
MPGSVKVKIMSARNLPIMDRATLLTDAFVEIRIGNTSYKTEVARRSLNPCWNSEWFCFELDDQALQEEALLLKVMDHDTYSSHDTIGRVYFDLNPLLSRGHSRSLNGWFPIYDTMHGIRGEISLSIRVDVFFDASRYRQSSLGVQFFHSCGVPNGYIVDLFIGFIQELVMTDDPEHQWIEKIRTSRASNEARQHLFSRLSGELQRKLGLKVLNLGGNSVIGYQLHFDLEGETGVVVRGIGTAVRLRKQTAPRSPPSSPVGAPQRFPGSIELNTESPVGSADTPSAERETPFKGSTGDLSQAMELGEFPFLTISQMPPGMIRHFGSIVASKSVKLMDKNTPAEIQFRDAWWLELRTEVAQHMYSVNCNAVIGYREECAIYEDVCILSNYGTAVVLDLRSPSLGQPVRSSFARYAEAQLNTELPVEPCVTEELDTSGISPASSPYLIKTDRRSSAGTVVPSPPGDSHTPRKHNFCRKSSKPLPASSNPDCSICHLARYPETATRQVSFQSTPSTKCAMCNAAPVPDVLLSSADFPAELLLTGKPSLIQARVCRSKKDVKGEVAANELSELLPFMEYELHYRLLQQLRLRRMNAIFGLRFRITIGEYFIATIATGTGVFASSLPSPPLPKIPHIRTPTSSVNDRLFRARLQKQLKDYIHKSHCLFGLGGQDGEKKETRVFQDPCDRRELRYEEQHIPVDSSVQTQTFYEFIDAEHTVNGSECPEEQDAGTVYLETREPEAEDLATFLREPLQPSGLLLTTTDLLPCNLEQTSFNEAVLSWVCGSEVCTSDNLAAQFCTLLGDDWIPVQSFTRIHEEKLTSSDSLIENNGIVPVTIRDANIDAATPFAGNFISKPGSFSHSSTVNPLATNPSSSSTGLVASKQGVSTNLLSSSFSSTTNVWPPNTNRNRSEQFLGPSNLGRSLSEILIDSNQLTWFRFRHLMPCVLSALDFRLTITDDDFLQVVTTGMVLVPAHRASHTCVTCSCDTKRSVTGGTLGSVTNTKATIGSKNLQTLHVSVSPNKLNHQQPCNSPELSKSSNRTREHPSPPPDLNDPLNGCLLTPLSSLPNTMVETYLGNLDFFFIRETNDLREVREQFVVFVSTFAL